MKKKIIFLMIPMLFFAKILGANASSMTCEYNYEKVITIEVKYNYGEQVKCEKKKGGSNRIFGSCEINSADFVDEKTGDVSCPKLTVKTTTPANKKFKYDFKADNENGKLSGTITDSNLDGKEKEDPSGDAILCYYNKGGNNEYTVTWTGEKAVFNLTGSSIKNYSITVKGTFTADLFKNKKCPTVYHSCVQKAKKCVFSTKEEDLFIGDDPTDPEDPYDGTPIPDPEPTEPDTDYDSSYGKCVSCGNGSLKDIPAALPQFIRNIVLTLQLLTPIVLIGLGIYDFIKAVISSDEKIMKESQNRFIKRIIAAILIFMVVAIVKFVFALIPGESTLGCIPCFISDSDSCGEEYVCEEPESDDSSDNDHESSSGHEHGGGGHSR